MKSKSGPTAAERAATDGLCHNMARHTKRFPTDSDECLKPAQWLGGTDMPDGSIWWSGVCDECKAAGGDVVNNIRHWKQYIQPHKRH